MRNFIECAVASWRYPSADNKHYNPNEPINLNLVSKISYSEEKTYYGTKYWKIIFQGVGEWGFNYETMAIEHYDKVLKAIRNEIHI